MTTKRASAVVLALQTAGVSSTLEISRATGLSQPSVSLAMKDLGDAIVRFGNARSTRYGLVRTVAGEGSSWPLYSIDQAGLPALVGYLTALQQGEWAFRAEPAFTWLNLREFSNGLYPGLPWFLDTLRPQGFLGRNFGRMVSPVLGLPLDPSDWTADQVLISALHHGMDFPGSFVLGDRALEAVQSSFLQDTGIMALEDRHFRYSELAASVLSGEMPGSSAGGEQPKFATVLRGEEDFRHVIVKFSGSGDNPIDQRWRDLLIVESIATDVISRIDVPVAKSKIFSFEQRTFLESCRFDRIGEFGRRFVVPLSAVDAAFYGEADTPWRQAADRLERDSLLSDEDAHRLRWLWWFGNLIGNDDMHYGNISLFSNSSGIFNLAPCYDMLPMRYRPSNSGEIVVRDPNPVPPPPQALELWRSASLCSLDFWNTVKDRAEVSESFKDIADANLGGIEKLRKRLA